MTNYNEKVDRVLSDYAEAICSYAYFGSPLNSDEDNIAGAEALYQTSQNEAKQAIASLIKELVAEAKPERQKTENMGDTFKVNWARGYNLAIDRFEQNLLKALSKEK